MHFEFGLLNIPVEGSFQVIERRVQVRLTLISILSVLTYKYMNKFIHDPMIIIALRAVPSGSYRDSEKYSSWIWWNGWIRNGDVILCHDTSRQTRQKGIPVGKHVKRGTALVSETIKSFLTLIVETTNSLSQKKNGRDINMKRKKRGKRKEEDERLKHRSDCVSNGTAPLCFFSYFHI